MAVAFVEAQSLPPAVEEMVVIEEVGTLREETVLSSEPLIETFDEGVLVTEVELLDDEDGLDQ